MKKIYLLLGFLITVTTVSAQFQNNRRGVNRNIGGIPQQAPSEREIEKQKEKAEERRQEFILNFLSTLEADEFQKEIAKQTITDFFTKSEEFIKLPFDTSTERKDAYEKFRDSHFTELKTLISEADTVKLDSFLKGDFKENDAKKKKKKKRRKRDN